MNESPPLPTRTPVEPVRVGDAHPLSLALFALTLASGFIDAVSYLGLGHVFTANMTGNVAVIGFALAGAPGFSITGSLISLAAFLIGAVGAGRLAARAATRSREPWVRAALITETSLQAGATVVAFAAPGQTRLLIALLALAMGLRNGTVRKLGVPDMTTTVLTLTITGIGADSSLAGGDNVRIRRRLLAIALMVTGAALGAVMVLHGLLPLALLASTVVVAAVAVGYREPKPAA
ncbi:YoaK family protein [Actinoallomurus vinaceus]|uniref:YoaK family protein n=1 Tax=Actinoallomurus vinaceus TaxID=1080074 RepID=A0ABP8U6I8_9ACTN